MYGTFEFDYCCFRLRFWCLSLVSCLFTLEWVLPVGISYLLETSFNCVTVLPIVFTLMNFIIRASYISVDLFYVLAADLVCCCIDACFSRCSYIPLLFVLNYEVIGGTRSKHRFAAQDLSFDYTIYIVEPHKELIGPFLLLRFQKSLSKITCALPTCVSWDGWNRTDFIWYCSQFHEVSRYNNVVLPHNS